MTLQEKLLPLVENTDYEISGSTITALPKVRMVPSQADPEVLEEEVYYEVVPSAEQFAILLREVALEQSDITLLVQEYLLDKSALRDPENDSINIVNNRIFNWNFANIPQPTLEELELLVPVVALRQSEIARKKTLSDLGAKSRLACQNCLDLIAGFNLQRSLTAEQITAMQASFGNIQTALMTSRPTSAKFLINALTPDEVIITTEMKETILSALQEF